MSFTKKQFNEIIGFILGFCLIGIFAFMSYSGYSFLSKNELEVPNAFNLPIGEHNRQESLYVGSSAVYVVKDDITLSSLPESAWCAQVTRSDSNFSLKCNWLDETDKVPLTMAIVDVPVDHNKYVDSWSFDRTSLQAVPTMYSWAGVNLGTILGMLFFGLLTVFGLLIICSSLVPKIERWRILRKV